MEKLYAQMWIDLPQETRNHLAKAFDIPRTGITEIRDQTVVSDGHTNTDLEAVTADKMAAYVGSPLGTLSFSRLWEITLSKVKYELHPPMLEIQPNGLITDVVPITNPAYLLEAPKKYCDNCVSTKGRHRKGCPKFK